MSVSSMKAVMTWSDAGIAIAGIGMVAALGMLVIWQFFVALREHLNRLDNPAGGLRPSGGSVAQGERE